MDEITGLVEKPKPAEAPSTLALIGRYVLQPEVFDHLGLHETGAGGEIQLTDALAKLIGVQPFHALRYTGRRYDCGSRHRLPRGERRRRAASADTRGGDAGAARAPAERLKPMRIAMIGSGYVGLVSGACFAQFGHDVVCVDKDAGKIARLRKGEMPIYEPGLDKLVDRQHARRPARPSAPISPTRWATPTRCSSPSARRPGAATATPT